MTKLLVKYNESYICEKYRNEIDFINIPMYYPNNQAFSNLSIWITLFTSNNLSPEYSSIKKLNSSEWSNLFEEYFIPEYLFQVDKETYIYDLDQLINDYNEYKPYYQKLIQNIQFPLTIRTINDLKNKNKKLELREDESYDWLYPITTINSTLEQFITKRHQKRRENDCLLLYSGGKDSTLAAIRLYNAGYNVHFIHFNNGHMLDTDKPYLTFQETFNKENEYYFDFELSNIDIKDIFNEYFNNLSTNIINNQELLSEIRCLSCRMAMYTKAIQIAKEKGYKYIAEGARISQKFMLEQLPITNRIKDLASSYGIKLLLPVLYVADDQKEIEELIANNHSSKTWESKCLIGKPAKDKTEEDKQFIINYYDSILKTSIQKKLKHI